MLSITDMLYQEIALHKEREERYASIINDLTLLLGLWLDGYEMDAEDPEKLRSLLCTACAMIGKPRTMEELVALLGLDMDGNTIDRGDSA